MGKPHVVAVPYPAQGHVIPLMVLAQCLVKRGFKVTFVNTEFNHKRIINAMLTEKNINVGDDENENEIHLVSIPDGLEPWEDRNELGKLTEAIFRVMPGKLEELIEKINGLGSDSTVTCIIGDVAMGWAFEVAEKMGIRRAAFWPASAALWALVFSIPKLINDRIIDNDGTPMKKQMIHLSPTMPAMSTSSLVWTCIGDFTAQKIVFDVMVKNNKTIKEVEWQICNSTNKLEPAAFTSFPQILPIGPLLATNPLAKSAGHFWQEDSSCLKWLDQQPLCSVIYVAFGSFTVFDQTQFQELALGLELTNRPFLWVVRPDITDQTTDYYPNGFEERVAIRGRRVGWAPQQKVLGHPSIACFLSHCGWNSIVEGVSNGIPFLCWPYFADQFLDQSYICDVWKIGLGFKRDERGIITQGEIKDKVEELLGDQTFKERALDLKEKVMDGIKEGGCSHKNLNKFIEWMKA